MSAEREDKDRRVGNYIASAIANAVVLFLVNKAPDWNLPFITDGYPAILWAMNLSLVVQVGGNALLLFFHPRFLHYLGQAVFGLVSGLAAIIMVAVFPFDFSFISGFINTIVRIVLVAAAIGSGVSVVVNLIRTLGSLVRARRD